MNKEVENLAIEVFEGRKAAEERIKKGEVKKSIVEKYVMQILKVFQASNEAVGSTVLIHQIKLVESTKKKESSLEIFVSFDKYRCFNNLSMFSDEQNKRFLGSNDKVTAILNNLKIPKELYEDIFEYFENNLSKYFKVFNDDELKCIIIEAKSPCET